MTDSHEVLLAETPPLVIFVRLLQPHTGNNPATRSKKVERSGNHRFCSDMKLSIQGLVVLGVTRDVIFNEPLFIGEDHADDARRKGLAELAYQSSRIRTSIECNYKRAFPAVMQPDRTFARSNAFEGA